MQRKVSELLGVVRAKASVRTELNGGGCMQGGASELALGVVGLTAIVKAELSRLNGGWMSLEPLASIRCADAASVCSPSRPRS